MTVQADESLDYAERWLRDGLQVLHPSLSVLQVTVDMTNALHRLEVLRRGGVQATATHLLVQAAARALAGNPALHQMIAGNRRHRPSQVDIGLSVAGDAFVAPVLIIENAGRKTVGEIATETASAAPKARENDRKMLALLRRWGWLLPFGVLRRAVLRLLFTSATFRRKGAGTFQVSIVPADWAFTTSFATAGVLFGGSVVQRVVVLEGQPAVRPTMTLTLSGDHGVWDGRAATRFVSAVKTLLESAEPESASP